MTVNRATDLTAAIVAALDDFDDVHPAVRMGMRGGRWLPWDPHRFAVDLGEEAVEIRIVAGSLPLSALVERVGAAVRPLLDESPWAGATLRVHVVALHADALGADSDPDHDSGP
ncbi:hypothetical protein [Nocardia thailandica]